MSILAYLLLNDIAITPYVKLFNVLQGGSVLGMVPSKS